MMSIKFSLHCWICLLLAMTTSSVVADPAESTTSIAPSNSPHPQPSGSPVPTVSHVPTAANFTQSPAPTRSQPPTMPPSKSQPPTTSPAPPSKSPAPTASVVPTSNSTSSIPPSNPPSISPGPSHPPSTSPSPSQPPSTSPAPSQVPSTPPNHRHISAWAILGKTIAWLLMSALAILAFGALFSNRYRIYYYLQSAWYTFLGFHYVRKVLRWLRLDGYFAGYRESSLNEVIFDNDLSLGLMMQDA